MMIGDDGTIIQLENMKVGVDTMDTFPDLGLGVKQ